MTDSNNTYTIHMTGVEGTVKWFSNRKGFGFLTPVNSTLTEEIFVHQTGIVTNGQFRTLAVSSVCCSVCVFVSRAREKSQCL